MEAKVTDFGMAKQATNGETHMSTRVMGTMGYLDPAYMETGKLVDGNEDRLAGYHVWMYVCEWVGSYLSGTVGSNGGSPLAICTSICTLVPWALWATWTPPMWTQVSW